MIPIVLDKTFKSEGNMLEVGRLVTIPIQFIDETLLGSIVYPIDAGSIHS